MNVIASMLALVGRYPRRVIENMRTRQPNSRFLLAMVLGFMVVATAACNGAAQEIGPPPGPPLQVEARKAATVSWESRLEVTGSVEPLRRAAPGTILMGRVDSVHHEEGDRVSKGDPLASIRSQDVEARLAQAEAAVEAARAAEKNALLTRERMERLYGRQAASKKNLDDAVADHEAAAANLKAAEEGVKAAKVHVDYSQVRAPFSGVVTRKNVEVGDMAAPGVPLFVVEDLSKMKVEAQVAESAVGGLGSGDPVQVHVAAASDASRPGTIAEILPAGDPRSRTFTIRVLLDNREGNLRSGMFARVLLPMAPRDGIAVPEESVVRRGPLSGIFVVDDGGVARLRWITLGDRRDGEVEVLTGLAEGETFVLLPPEDLEDGRHVAARR